ncbi:MAG: NAD-dependent deacetylase [Promethearchaeota archaeon]
MNDYQLAVEWILESKYTVLFTGAGVSVESGIPPFRGENGLWSKYDPTFLMTNYFKKHPKESWKLINEIFYKFFSRAKPNQAHYIITELEKKGLIDIIITQNIDNLHQKAGSKNVIEFHGTSRTLTCINCKRRFDNDKFLNKLPPHCPKCNGLLKPDFVFFNEPIPLQVHELSNKCALMSDLFILVGTTGEIMPASLIPYFAREKGARIIEINIIPTKYTDRIVDVFLEGKATEVFLKLKESLDVI